MAGPGVRFMAVKPCGVHKLVVDIALLAEGHVLMVRYRDTSRYDNQSGWFLPDDYIMHLEHPDDAARRIAKDQAAISFTKVRLDHIESFGNGAWHLIFHYRVDLESKRAVKSEGNVRDIAWFPLDKLPEVAHHGWALGVLRTILGTQ